tara:strand:- start:9285 stop:9788 length:504 start_codon:yes stop_codon:yes gene_type:complete
MKSLFYFVFKKIAPIRYAKYIGVKLGKNCRLINVDFSSEPYLISMGDHVSATATRFETHDGGVWVLRELGEPKIDIVKPIKIGNNVFIGYGAIIMPGVVIGDNVVIGAKSLVSRDIPSNSVAVGTPARVIKTIEDYRLNSESIGDLTKGLSRLEKEKFYKNKYKDLL